MAARAVQDGAKAVNVLYVYTPNIGKDLHYRKDRLKKFKRYMVMYV